MKRIILLIVATAITFAFATESNAQCKNFAQKICKLELLPYIHDGIYNATTLAEGETAELFKTFYSGQEYRLAICGDDMLPRVEFEVLDGERNVLFSNKNNNYSKVWDFKLESSQQLIISIQVPTNDKMSDQLASGCVAVLVGFLNNENSFDQF
ncbi:MAG: hypothetical protein A2W98_05935 [Bacteroidetes bacterium GWF2_33_38]|nr:MAG: hypothetical protein A2W98_05935 [Bacteroidetes bacterium GWF2_33_38]OFY68637.1 MAG: hypothetical protein A2265_09220 [Bacteroidetes bacterium RIFOXYA12_FULL_33_9]OFY91949.1 MAG: hypothetical protein A2236_02135 [Bacteroidetes bacterium RIFOXYA2_FULL_33_7]HBX49601.1 hypothetical protein [Bacteroidales bacterium]